MCYRYTTIQKIEATPELAWDGLDRRVKKAKKRYPRVTE